MLKLDMKDEYIDAFTFLFAWNNMTVAWESGKSPGICKDKSDKVLGR